MGSSLTNKGNQKLTYSQLPCIDCCNLSAANQQHEAIDDLKSQHLISSGSQMRVLLTAVVCFPPRCIFTALCLGSNRMEVELMMEGHGWKRGAGGWTTHCVHSVWAGKQLLIKSEERRTNPNPNPAPNEMNAQVFSGRLPLRIDTYGFTARCECESVRVTSPAAGCFYK